MPSAQGLWLVRTGGGPGQPAGGASEIQRFPAGQKPLSANWGGAVYLGTTNADVKRWIGVASHRLGVPNPQRVPDLGTSVGILSSILGGFGAAAAAESTAVGEATAVGTSGGTAAEGAAGGAAGSRLAKRAALGAGVAGAGLGLGGADDFFNLISWIFHPLNWLRMVEFLTGLLFIVIGLRTSSHVFRGATPSPFARRLMNMTPIGREMRIARRARGYREGAVARERASQQNSSAETST